MKLWAETLSGNLFHAADTINSDKFWVKFSHIYHMSFGSGNYTIVVFQVTNKEYARLVKKYRSPSSPKLTSPGEIQ